MRRGDLIEVDGTRYIVVLMQWHDNEEPRMMAWDYKAWADGMYDAYRPFDIFVPECQERGYYEGLPSEKAAILGNIIDNPELLPPECDGYNGEPVAVKIETIWENPAFK